MPPLHSSFLNRFLHFLSQHYALYWTLPALSFPVSVGLKELLVHFADLPVRMIDEFGVPCDFFIELLQLFFAYCWLNTYDFLIESDVVLRKVEFLLPLLILILQRESSPPKMPLTRSSVGGPSPLYFYK